MYLDLKRKFVKELEQEMHHKFKISGGNNPFYNVSKSVNEIKNDLFPEFIIDIIRVNNFEIVESLTESNRKELLNHYNLKKLELLKIFSYSFRIEEKEKERIMILTSLYDSILKDTIDYKKFSFPFIEKIEKIDLIVGEIPSLENIIKELRDIRIEDKFYSDYIKSCRLSFLCELYKQSKLPIKKQIGLLKKYKPNHIRKHKGNLNACSSKESLNNNFKQEDFIKNRIRILEFFKNKEHYLEKYPKVIELVRKGLSQSQISKKEKLSIVTVNNIAKVVKEIDSPTMFSKPISFKENDTLTKQQINYLTKHFNVAEFLLKGVSQRETRKRVNVGLNTINKVSKILEIRNRYYKKRFFKQQEEDQRKRELSEKLKNF